MRRCVLDESRDFAQSELEIDVPKKLCVSSPSIVRPVIFSSGHSFEFA